MLSRRTPPPLPADLECSVVHVVGAAVLGGGTCLVARRKPGGPAGGKWEFPGGKIEAGESPEAALRREILEELEVRVDVHEWIGRGTEQTDGRLIVLDVYRVTLAGVPLTQAGDAHDEILWADERRLNELEWASADIPVVDRVIQLLKGESRGSHQHV